MVNVGQQVGGSIGTSLLNTIAASAIASFAPANGSEGLAVLPGYHVGFTWSAAILLAAAVTTALLLRRPAATPASEPDPAASPAPAAGPARCLAACCE
jgi:hypothetical protein